MFARAGEHWLPLLIVLLLVVLLFGFKRLPDAARSVGRSMRIFKSEMSEMKNDGKPGSTIQGETLNEQQTAAAEARRKAAEARAAAERAEAEAADAERAANGSTRF